MILLESRCGLKLICSKDETILNTRGMISIMMGLLQTSGVKNYIYPCLHNFLVKFYFSV